MKKRHRPHHSRHHHHSPSNVSIVIPDLSHYNKVYVDPALLGSPALINKTTQGHSFVDPTWAARSKDVLEHGKLIGGYLFATGDRPADQVTLFLTTVMDALGTASAPQLKLAVDYEPYPENQCSMRQAEQIVTAITVATGKKPLLYMDLSVWNESKNSNILMGCDLWLAEYGPTARAPHKLWQYTDSASIIGVHVPCDASLWQGDLPALTAWWAT